MSHSLSHHDGFLHHASPRLVQAGPALKWASSSYDTQLNQVRKLTADVVLLDLPLGQFGPEAHEARDRLRRAIDPTIRVGECVAKGARGGMSRLTRAAARRASG